MTNVREKAFLKIEKETRDYLDSLMPSYASKYLEMQLDRIHELVVEMEYDLEELAEEKIEWEERQSSWELLNGK